MRKSLLMMLAALLLIPSVTLAAPSIEELQKQISDIAQQLDELEGRVEGPERHTALDRITWYGDFRNTVDSVHYKNVAWSPGMLVNMGPNGNHYVSAVTGAPLEAALGGGAVPVEKYDINNDLLYTSRLRLSMKANIYKNMNFSGRLTMYKNWGDSVGTNVLDSWDAFTMDGTDGGSPSGDWLRVERAYFNWKHIADTGFYLSVGRRPSTYGSPTNIRENTPRGGTPTGHLVNFNFDGLTIGYHAEALTGLEGSAIRFCYGQGFESEWGNGTLFNNNSNLEDTHLGGFNIDVLNNDAWLVQVTLFRAMDVVDGFKGTFAFPSQFVNLFTDSIAQDTALFPNINFITRYTPSTVIGDINLIGTNATYTTMDGMIFFGSIGMTQLEPNGKAGMFGGMGTDAVFNVDADGNITGIQGAENDDTQEGYGIYVGMQIPAPMGKFGLEYNYGSEYWTPFTQAQDDVVGSKLATRGHAAEAYYIFDINRHAFIKIGGIFYDYEYTGSGSPVGKPQKVDDVLDGKAVSLLPVVDKAWDAYAQINMKW